MAIRAEICENPIFIIGSPRSGTSILAWALAQHPAFCTFDESDVLWNLFHRNHAEKAYDAAAARPDGKDWLTRNHVSREEFLAYLGFGINALVTSRSSN